MKVVLSGGLPGGRLSTGALSARRAGLRAGVESWFVRRIGGYKNHTKGGSKKVVVRRDKRNETSRKSKKLTKKDTKDTKKSKKKENDVE